MADFGTIYVFNLWEGTLGISLNSTTLSAGLAAPSATSQPPYTPNAASAMKTNLTMKQSPGPLFMCGMDNLNEMYFQFGQDKWRQDVYIPGDDDGVPSNRDGFIYVAFKKLFVFDADGRQILQPSDTKVAQVKP